MTKLTEIKIWPVKNNQYIKANASFVYDETIRIKCIIRNGNDGLWVTYPAAKSDNKDENGKDIWYPYVNVTDKTKREEISKELLAAYAESAGGTSTQERPRQQQDGFDDNVPF